MSTSTGKIESMRLRSPLLVAIAAIAAILPLVAAAQGRDYALGKLTIEHPHARPTPPGARTGGAYFTVANAGSVPDRLVRVVSPAAATTELHAMTMDGNLMKMRPVAGLDIPAGSRVALGAGGYHVMLIDLERPLAAGDTVVLTLTFAKAGSIEISAPVEASAGAAAPARKPAHAH